MQSFCLVGKIKWLFVTYGIIQKMFLLQSPQFLAEIAFFSLPQIDHISSLYFSESFVIIHKYINLTFVHTIVLSSIYYSRKISDGEIVFFQMIEWPPSFGIFCLSIYNQTPMGKIWAVEWHRTKFKHEIYHVLDVCPWNKLFKF